MDTQPLEPLREDTDILYSVQLLTQSFTTWYKLHKDSVVIRQKKQVLQQENWDFKYPRTFIDLLKQHHCEKHHIIYRNHFSTIYCNESVESFVFKKVHRRSDEVHTMMMALKETCLLRSSIHRSLVSSVSSQLQMKKGRLHKVIHKLPRASFNLKDYINYGMLTSPVIVFSIVEALLSALHALHVRHVVHGDIKADNIFLYSFQGGLIQTRLGDFSLSTLEGCDVVIPTSDVVPETQGSQPCYTKASDMYALGQVLTLLLYHDEEPRFTFNTQHSDYSVYSSLQSLHQRINHREPSKRPTVTEAMAVLSMKLPNTTGTTGSIPQRSRLLPPSASPLPALTYKWKCNEKEHYETLLRQALDTYRTPVTSHAFPRRLYHRTVSLSRRLHEALSRRRVTYTLKQCVVLGLITTVGLFESLDMRITTFPMEPSIFHVLQLLDFQLFTYPESEEEEKNTRQAKTETEQVVVKTGEDEVVPSAINTKEYSAAYSTTFTQVRKTNGKRSHEPTGEAPDATTYYSVGKTGPAATSISDPSQAGFPYYYSSGH